MVTVKRFSGRSLLQQRRGLARSQDFAGSRLPSRSQVSVEPLGGLDHALAQNVAHNAVLPNHALPNDALLTNHALSNDALLGRRPLPPGHLIEISGECYRATLAIAEILQTQQRGELVAWVMSEQGTLYPPDLHVRGVNLDMLIVARLDTARDRIHSLFRCAEILLRSGGFGLLVLDLRTIPHHYPALRHPAWQSRLLGLARKHRSCLLLLSNNPESSESLGSLIALRIEGTSRLLKPGYVLLEPQILKSKLSNIELRPSLYRLPEGLC